MKILLIIISLTLTACATGTKISQNFIDTLEIGKTSKSEIISNLGSPISFTYTAEGKSMASWAYFDNGAFALIPLTQHLSVLFNDKDVLEKFTMTRSGR